MDDADLEEVRLIARPVVLQRLLTTKQIRKARLAQLKSQAPNNSRGGATDAGRGASDDKQYVLLIRNAVLC